MLLHVVLRLNRRTRVVKILTFSVVYPNLTVNYIIYKYEGELQNDLCIEKSEFCKKDGAECLNGSTCVKQLYSLE